jgi:hypothetical protein
VGRDAAWLPGFVKLKLRALGFMIIVTREPKLLAIVPEKDVR